MTKLMIATLLFVGSTAFAAADKADKKAETKREPNQVRADYTCQTVRNQNEASNLVSSCSGVVATTTEPSLLACCPAGGGGGGFGGGGGGGGR